jgi:hypothetical protein
MEQVMSNIVWINPETGVWGSADDLRLVDLDAYAAKRGVSVENLKQEASNPGNIVEVKRVALSEGLPLIGWRSLPLTEQDPMAKNYGDAPKEHETR